MNKRSSLALLALTLVILSLPLTAQAENVFQFSAGRSADAGFSSTDSSGCIQTSVLTVAFDGKFQAPPEAGSSFSEVFINISQSDNCTGVLLMDAVGRTSLATPDFHVTRDLSSATLEGAVNVCDLVSTDCFDVLTDLTWTANGAGNRSNSHFHSQELGLVINSFDKGASRPAQASGSVSNGVTNFTPNPGIAHLLSYMSGTLTVSLPR